MDIFQLRQLCCRNILVDTRITIATTIHQVEIPVSCRHAVKRIVILVIIIVQICAVILTVLKDCRSEGVTCGMVTHGYCIGKSSIFNPQLHTTRAETTHRRHQPRILIPARREIQGGNLRFLIGGTNHNQQMRVYPDIFTAVCQQSLHTHNVVTTVDGQRVSSASVIPTGIMRRIRLRKLVIRPYLGKHTWNRFQNIPFRVRQSVFYFTVIVTRRLRHRKHHPERNLLPSHQYDTKAHHHCQ